jgi:exopolyphosphatase/guanosine-5'-triphosphate,3'-diphosphate pyrophosphatase
MRLATIDIGTNTAQLLVVEVPDDPDRAPRPVHDAERFVRLGEGVDARGQIGDAALTRLLDALDDHRSAAEKHGADRIVAAATSAVRDAANRTAVLDAVRSRLGVEAEVLSGPEEATWSFAAACAPFDDLTGDCLVVDVGGGSTELIAGRAPSAHHPDYAAAITGRTSLDVGCVRLTERLFSEQPPAEGAVRRAEATIDRALESADLPVAPGAVLVGTAGTATALALVDAGPDSTPDRLHDAPALAAPTVEAWRSRLLEQTVDEILALHPEAMPGRADVFPAGVMLLAGVMRRFGLTPCRVSPCELRYGLALRALARRG